MPHSKKPKLTHDDADATTAASLSSDELAIIFGCLGPLDILPLRRVCKKWNEGAKKTIVPLADFEVKDEKSHHIMKTMSSALPKLQKLELSRLKCDYLNDVYHFYADGEDPDEDRNHRSGDSIVTHQIDMISNFTNLRVLELRSTPLNGSYPYLFNFPLLNKLTVRHCKNLRWDLGMLAGLPLLKELNFYESGRLTGNINNLRLLKDTLEKVIITSCTRVEGNFMDLADFPHLKVLLLGSNMKSITGDIRDMGEASFPKLENLLLPSSVYGGDHSEIMRISDAKDLIATIYSIKKQRHRHPSLFDNFKWRLSKDSPDGFGELWEYQNYSFCFVRAGSRIGWRWEKLFDYTADYAFEVNWLDPLPASGMHSYIEGLQEIESYMNRFPFFRGYYEPPSEAVYKRLCREYRPSQEETECWENL